MTSNGFRVVSSLVCTLVSLSAYSQSEILAVPVPAPAANTAMTPLTANAQVTPAASTVTPVSTAKDWRLLDLGTSCVAETVAVVDSVNYHLEVRVEKAPASPLEMTIRSEVASPATIGFTAALDAAKTKVYAFAKLSGPGGEETFWNIPRGSADLVSYLKREMKFDVQAVEAAGAVGKVVTFSLRGSSDTLTNLGRKCAAGLAVPTLADTTFEKAFLPQVVATVDLGRVNPAKADLLRSLIKTAREAFLSSKASQSEIEKLNAKYLKELKELAGLRSNIDRLTAKDVARLEAARLAAQNAITQSETEILNLKPQIATAETSLVQANSAYEAAYDVLKPLIPENNRLAANVRAAQTRETEAQGRLANIESILSQAKANLQSLENESQQLRSNYGAAQDDNRHARHEYQRAEQDARNFNAQDEVRRRLSSDRRMDDLRSQVQDFERRIQNQEGTVKQADGDRDRANRDLTACQGTTPVRDCTSEKQRLQDAQGRLQDARQTLTSLENSREEKRREMGEIRRRIEAEVARIENELNRRFADARGRMQNTEMRLRDLENRMRAVDQIEIPDRQNEIARLGQERATANQDIANAHRSVQNARTALANYRQSVNFDTLQADVNTKLAAVNSFKTQLATIDREIKKREQVITANQKQLAVIANEMGKVLAQIKAKETRSIDVQKLLEPYEVAKADLNLKKATSEQAFARAQSDFVANL